MEIITKSPIETKDVGRKFATSLIEGKRKFLTLGLIGDLGAGKTTFVQGFAEGLGIKQRIISPTFILLRKYDLPVEKNRLNSFYHVDLYRIENNVLEEVRNLGLSDVWEKQGNVVVVEWAERIKEIFPKESYTVYFNDFGEGRRKIIVSG